MKTLPATTHQPLALVGGDGFKGFWGRHKVGEKPPSDIRRYGGGACDGCHTRQSFSAKEAGILAKPADWAYAPDLLQFYGAKSTAEQELDLMFMEYRMRTVQGAFHATPDYAHRYGWAKLKEVSARFREDAARLRREGK